MSEIDVQEKLTLDLTPAKRCSDYDSDCEHVSDHYACWKGGIYFDFKGISYETVPADGYCPYLLGQAK